MIVRNQANIGTTNNQIQKDQDSLLFTGKGGISTMSLAAKNIPPMKADDLPDEVQIKLKNEVLQNKVLSYDKECLKLLTCNKEIGFFRFQIIFDDYEFLYYPMCRLEEKPYLILESNLNSGATQIVINLDLGLNDTKNATLLKENDIIEFVDYGDRYRITDVNIAGNVYYYTLDTPTTRDYYKNDILVTPYKQYLDINKSNITTDGTISSYKFKFTQVHFSNTNKNYILERTTKASSNEFILFNDDFTSIVDLQSNIRYVSLSKNINISPSTTTLNGDINNTTIEIEFTHDVDGVLDVFSYFTLKSGNIIEIMKVIEFLDTDKVKVERGQLNTSAQSFTAASTDVYFPLNIYFFMVPYNKNITDRYVLYRNLDFVTTQV